MANLNLSEFTEKLFVADADHTFIWDTAASISKRVSRNSWLSGTTADFHLGLADAASPVAQTISVQSVVAGTSNTAGANFSINGSQGTGTGAGGSLLLRTSPAGSSGTAQNALVTAVAITSAGNVGIGTTDPDSSLTVRSTTNNVNGVGQLILLSSDALAADKGGRFGLAGIYDNVNGRALFAEVAGLKENATSGNWAGYLTLRTRAAGGAITDRLRIDSVGNVGIGTTSPTSNLTVAQSTAGVGTISVGAAGTTVTGVGTQFLNTFAVGQTITSAGQTLTISAIASDTSMTISPAAGAAISGQAYTLVGGTRFTVAGNGKVGIGANVFLERDGDNVLALRNGSAAQAFRVYNTYTAADNYERAVFGYGSNQINLGSDVAGSGVHRKLNILGAGIDFYHAGIGIRWSINTSGHFIAAADNTYDIGASGAGRPRNVYVGGFVSAELGFGKSGVGGTTQGISFSGSSTNVNGGGNGAIVNLQDNSGNLYLSLTTGITRFGGTTASFPALKRSSTTLQARLADDSAFAAIQGKLTTDTAFTATTVTPTGFITLYDSTGAAYKVPCVPA